MKKIISVIVIAVGILLLVNYCNENSKKYDLSKARNLVDKYYIKNLFSGDMFDGLTDKYKFWLAYEKLESDKIKTMSCDELYKNKNIKKDSKGYIVGNSKYCDKSAKAVSYEDMNNSYKDLFGSDETLSKKDISQFNYVKDKNVFAELDCRCEGSFAIVNVFGIMEAKKEENLLKIKVQYSLLSRIGDKKYYSELNGKTYFYDDVFSDGFEKRYIKENEAIINLYTLTYKIDNNHYVLKKLEKIR